MRPRHIFFASIVSIAIVASVAAQGNREAELVSAPSIKIPDAAYDAGLSGRVVIAVSVDKNGTAKDARVVGGPMWPCGTHPDEELRLVNKAVIDSLTAAKYSPRMKDGKAADADILITYAIKPRMDPAPAPRLINGGVITGKAKSLAKPAYPPAARANRLTGPATVEVMVDETGKVAKAGVIKGHPIFFENAREAACRSKFEPTMLHGNAVRITGTLTYVFMP